MASCQHFFCHRIWQRRWHRIPVVICTRAGGGQLSSGCVKPQRHAKLAQIRAAQRTHAQPLSRTAQLMRQQRNTLMTSVDIWSTSMMQHSHHNIRRGHLSSFVAGSWLFFASCQYRPDLDARPHCNRRHMCLLWSCQ